MYNIVYRYLFDRRRDLAFPTSFLIDTDGMIVKIYQGPVDMKQVLQDLKSAPRTSTDRIRKALPMEGRLYRETFQRNDFTYGVAFFQHGYLDQAEASFKQVIASKPDDPEAHYNLGTLYLRRNSLAEARQYLERTVKLRPDYPEAWNNLGMLDAQQGHPDEAARNFQQALSLRPQLCCRDRKPGKSLPAAGRFREHQKLLNRALELEPDNAEVNYNLEMLYARQDQLDRAAQYLQRATVLRPDYPDALNNLGVLFVREKANYSAAEDKFNTCIPVGSGFRSGVHQPGPRLRHFERQRKSQGNLAGSPALATATQGGSAGA